VSTQLIAALVILTMILGGFVMMAGPDEVQTASVPEVEPTVDVPTETPQTQAPETNPEPIIDAPRSFQGPQKVPMTRSPMTRGSMELSGTGGWALYYVTGSTEGVSSLYDGGESAFKADHGIDGGDDYVGYFNDVYNISVDDGQGNMTNETHDEDHEAIAYAVFDLSGLAADLSQIIIDSAMLNLSVTTADSEGSAGVVEWMTGISAAPSGADLTTSGTSLSGSWAELGSGGDGSIPFPGTVAETPGDSFGSGGKIVVRIRTATATAPPDHFGAIDPASYSLQVSFHSANQAPSIDSLSVSGSGESFTAAWSITDPDIAGGDTITVTSLVATHQEDNQKTVDLTSEVTDPVGNTSLNIDASGWSSGSWGLTMAIQDGQGEAATYDTPATFEVNHPASVTSFTVTNEDGSPYTPGRDDPVNITWEVSDGSKDFDENDTISVSLSYILDDDPTEKSLQSNIAEGNTYTWNLSQPILKSGNYTITYTVKDGVNDPVSGNVSTLVSLNRAPTKAKITDVTPTDVDPSDPENSVVTIKFEVEDPEGDEITVTLWWEIKVEDEWIKQGDYEPTRAKDNFFSEKKAWNEENSEATLDLSEVSDLSEMDNVEIRFGISATDGTHTTGTESTSNKEITLDIPGVLTEFVHQAGEPDYTTNTKVYNFTVTYTDATAPEGGAPKLVIDGEEMPMTLITEEKASEMNMSDLDPTMYDGNFTNGEVYYYSAQFGGPDGYDNHTVWLMSDGKVWEDPAFNVSITVDPVKEPEAPPTDDDDDTDDDTPTATFDPLDLTEYDKRYEDDSTDTDKDGIPDWWEEEYGLDPEDPSDGGEGSYNKIAYDAAETANELLDEVEEEEDNAMLFWIIIIIVIVVVVVLVLVLVMKKKKQEEMPEGDLSAEGDMAPPQEGEYYGEQGELGADAWDGDQMPPQDQQYGPDGQPMYPEQQQQFPEQMGPDGQPMYPEQQQQFPEQQQQFPEQQPPQQQQFPEQQQQFPQQQPMAEGAPMAGQQNLPPQNQGPEQMQMACHNCGEVMNILVTERPMTVTCPACGTLGEIS